MPRQNSSPSNLRSASHSPTQAREAIPKIQRRLKDLSSLDVSTLTNETGYAVLRSLTTKVNHTLLEIFGADTHEYIAHSIDQIAPEFFIIGSETDVSIRGNIKTVRSNISAAVLKLQTLLDLLEEKAGEANVDTTAKLLRAYEGLELHPEIARAASTLYRNGHFANAVEASVKALNGLVRLRSDLEHDGTTLMERTFNPANPVLKFNDLSNQSDKDEQKGFMNLFCGAVSGLRNPRAHGFIEDSPERALEFIAFVSLLAKLLDKSSR